MMFLCVSCLCAAAEKPPADFKLLDTEATPNRSLVIEHYSCEAKELAQIWTSEEGNATNRAFLFEYSRSAEVKVSHDDKWLVVNTYEGSNMAAPILFRKTSGIRFEKVKGIDLERVVWDAAATNQGFTETVFDHCYSEVLCWLGESHSLVLRAWGHQSGEYYLDDWFCIYDVKTKKVDLDLKALNKGTFHTLKEKKAWEKQPTIK